jgi:hypothetical protein
MSLLFLVISLEGWCQFTGDARSMAMGNIRTARGKLWAVANNPACLNGPEGISAGLSVMNRYLLEELKDVSFAVNYCFQKNGIGITGSLSGFGPYIKQWYGISYGHKFSRAISSGISLIYVNSGSSENRYTNHSITYKIGMETVMGNRTTLSFCGLNPFGAAYSSNAQVKPPSVYCLGITYQVSDGLQVEAEIESGTKTRSIIKAGMEYGVQERFFLRLGLLSSPFNLTSGIGLTMKYLALDIALAYHSYLGFSPVISIIYNNQTRNHEGE